MNNIVNDRHESSSSNSTNVIILVTEATLHTGHDEGQQAGHKVLHTIYILRSRLPMEKYCTVLRWSGKKPGARATTHLAYGENVFDAQQSGVVHLPHVLLHKLNENVNQRRHLVT
jgi:hypothetical protein